MRLDIRDSKIGQLIKRRNTLTILLVFSLVLNLVQELSIGSLIGKTRIVIVPPEIREEFWVEPKAVSYEYLQQMTDYFLTLILNATPSTVASKRDLLLKFVHPSSYGLVKEQLLTDETEIKKRHISRFFVPVSYEINNAERWVKTLGDLTTLVGQEKVSVERMEYRIQYHLEQGRLFIEEFSWEKANA